MYVPRTLLGVWHVESLKANPIYVAWKEVSFQGLQQHNLIFIDVMDHVRAITNELELSFVLLGVVKEG